MNLLIVFYPARWAGLGKWPGRWPYELIDRIVPQLGKSLGRWRCGRDAANQIPPTIVNWVAAPEGLVISVTTVSTF
jgi:hypothetical protein